MGVKTRRLTATIKSYTLLAYATQLFLYLFVPMIVGLCLDHTPSAGITAASIMFGSHPVAAVFAMSFPEMGRLPITVHWGVCSIVQVAFAAFLLTLSGLALRRVARREGERATGLPPEAYEPVRVVPLAPPPLPPPLAPSGIGADLPTDGGLSLPAGETGVNREAGNREAASGSGQAPGLPSALPLTVAPPVVPYRVPASRGKSPREVSDNPILWREIRRPLLGRLWMRITATIACIVLLLVTYGAMGASDLFRGSRHEEQIGFAIVFSGLFWLLTAVLSATAIASEKESDTWTLLLTTPVSGSAVVWGKVAGLLRRLLWPTLLVAAHFILFTLIGHVPVLTTAFVLWVMITFNSIWIATGLYLSLRMRRVTFAVITNLMLAVAAYAIVPAVLFVLAQLVDERHNERWVENGIWHLPYAYLGNFFDGYFRNHDSWRSFPELTYWLPVIHETTLQVFLLVTFVIGCLHLLVSWMILQRTAVAFDAIVGRAGKNVHGAEFDPDDVAILSSSAAYAGFWRRAVGFVIDTIIVQAGCGAIGLLIGVGVLLIAEPSDEPPGAVLARYVALGVAASLVIGWLYYALFETSRRRATPGKSVMRAFVTDGDGRRISFGRASGRYWSKLLSGMLLGTGYLIAPFSPQMRAMHDRLADTLVLKR